MSLTYRHRVMLQNVLRGELSRPKPCKAIESWIAVTAIVGLLFMVIGG